MQRKEILEKSKYELFAKIDKMYEKIRDIDQELRQITIDERFKYLQTLNIDANCILVGLARHMDYHYTMIQVMQVRSIDKGAATINCIVSKYRCDDYHYSVSVTQENICVNKINSLFEEFDIYKLNPKQFDELINAMMQCKITTDNFEKYKSIITQGVDGCDSTRIKS